MATDIQVLVEDTAVQVAIQDVSQQVIVDTADAQVVSITETTEVQVVLPEIFTQVISMGEQGPSGAQGIQGIPGSGNSTITLQAGEILVAGDPVYVSGNTFLKADNTTNFKAVGIITIGAAIGFPATATTSGPVTLSGLTPNAVYFLGNKVITSVVSISGYVVRLGQAISNTVLLINIEEPVLLI